MLMWTLPASVQGAIPYPYCRDLSTPKTHNVLNVTEIGYFGGWHYALVQTPQSTFESLYRFKNRPFRLSSAKLVIDFDKVNFRPDLIHQSPNNAETPNRTSATQTFLSFSQMDQNPFLPSEKILALSIDGTYRNRYLTIKTGKKKNHQAFELPDGEIDFGFLTRDQIVFTSDQPMANQSRSIKIFLQTRTSDSLVTRELFQFPPSIRVVTLTEVDLGNTPHLLVSGRNSIDGTLAYYLINPDASIQLLHIPGELMYLSVNFADSLLMTNTSTIKVGPLTAPAGSLIQFPIAPNQLNQPDQQNHTTKQLAPKILLGREHGTAIEDVTHIGNRLVIFRRKDGFAKLDYIHLGSKPKLVPIEIPQDTIPSYSHASSSAGYEFIGNSLSLGRISLKMTPKNIQIVSSTSTFSSGRTQLSRHRFETKSFDGKSITYFVYGKSGTTFEKPKPMYMYVYGGFGDFTSIEPDSTMSHNWIVSKDRIYVVPLIRGGGEYGPASELETKGVGREISLQDLRSVMEDLYSRGIAEPSKSFIQGESHGAFMASLLATRYPNLLRGVINFSPILDMMEYPSYGFGPGWYYEYGNPNDPKVRDSLRRLSPLHNLFPGHTTYPSFFLAAAKNDDRTSVYHPRAMHEKLRQLQLDSTYVEYPIGGHGFYSYTKPQEQDLWSRVFSFIEERLTSKNEQ
jgi:prolyl oligopeptidase PreP (S9A serine peptidase family)